MGGLDEAHHGVALVHVRDARGLHEQPVPEVARHVELGAASERWARTQPAAGECEGRETRRQREAATGHQPTLAFVVNERIAPDFSAKTETFPGGSANVASPCKSVVAVSAPACTVAPVDGLPLPRSS